MKVRRAYRDSSGNIQMETIMEYQLMLKENKEYVLVLYPVHEELYMYHSDFRWDYVERVIRDHGYGQYYIII